VSFDSRAGSYERGRLGEWHRLVARRAADVALAEVSSPPRTLDVGCGTGMLLRELAARLPGAAELVGIDPAPTAPWLRPTTILSGRARTPRHAARLLVLAGLPHVTCRRVYVGPFPLVQAALAAR
jgi:SAM-dependent methyltransferase